MNRYFIDVSFNGTCYHGWQRQPNGLTVQEILEVNVSKLFRKTIRITGAGRTDAGVHARHYMAHFDADPEDLHLQSEWINTLNRMLPKDIVIHQVRKVNQEAHARFDALSRTYQYVILREKNPFKNEFAWYYWGPLDREAMNKAALLFLGKQDFTSFSKLHTKTKTNLCTVMEAHWDIQEDCMVFTVRADRFLRNMVRAMVGTLVDVGRGKTSGEAIQRILQAKNRCEAGASVPAQGLFLSGIEYPKRYFLS